MGRYQRPKWKGAHLRRMAKLIEFKPDESQLFEALTVIFFGADNPSGKEAKLSIKAEDEFAKYPETKDSVFAMQGCPFCRQRIGQSARIHTLEEGKGTDIIFDDRVFDYVFSRFDQWTALHDPKLKRAFVTLWDRFNKAKENTELDDIKAIMEYIRKRDSTAMAVIGT